MRRRDRELSGIEEIEEIITKADVCRVAIANNNLPYIVTMNFGYIRNPRQTLFFHCANEGKKLDMISQNNFVCFEMDTDHHLYRGKKSCDWGMKYKSIVGYGNISIVTEKEEKIRGLNSIMEHYGEEVDHLYDDKVFQQTTVLRLEILDMTGKKR